jgi:cell division protein FtsI (penicillin-binding protein 3)
LALLSGLAVLFGDGERNHPFVANRLVDSEGGVETRLERTGPATAEDLPADILEISDIRSLLAAQAEAGPARALLFGDSLLAGQESGGYQRLQRNDLVYATLPAGNDTLHLLLLVQSAPAGVVRGEDQSQAILQQLVADRLERLSVLQQIGRSVAEYVEPEEGGGGNYLLLLKDLPAEAPALAETGGREQPPGTIPDLTGLSLRKSLRQLDALKLKISISGSGMVVSQQPPPGSLVHPGQECRLILESADKLTRQKSASRAVEGR